MAVTGLLLVAFLLMHMFGNTKLFLGHEAFNEYSESLRSFLHPILPDMFFLWCFRIVLVLAIIIHVYCAISIWHTAKKAGGVAYAQFGKGTHRYVPTLMRWGGIGMVLFVVFHILQFTAEVVTVGYSGERGESGHIIDPAMRVINAFQPQYWYIFVIYLLAMVIVSYHVYHGVWSALTTLGANVSAKGLTILKVCSIVIALAIFVGFMVTPCAIITGVIR